MKLLISIGAFLLSVILGIGLGLIISKHDTKLTWKQLLRLKYEMLILMPILKLIYKRIRKEKIKLGKLYKLRNKL